MNEVVDSRITPHIQKAMMRGVHRDIDHSNDTDLVVYLLYYIHYFINQDIEDLWIRDKSRHMPVHKLGVVFGTQLCNVILKSHVLTGCDVTSKVGAKAAALNSESEQYLESLGGMNEPSLESFEKAEKYHVRVLQKNS